jgi:D-aminopeptidase
MSSQFPRQRVRALLPNLHLGFHAPGPLNSLTDVPGVLVHTQSINQPAGHDPARPASVINTGVTTILPRRDWFSSACYAGIFSFNGSGELTGSHWINETGLLNSPIVLTNSLSVGEAYSGVYKYAVREYGDPKTGLVDWFLLPVVGETYDGFMNDIGAMVVTPDMVVKGIQQASSDRVLEGNTGGGTGMLTMGHKAGTGSASRIVQGLVRGESREFVVGALVQSNFGKLNDLRFGTVPVGRILEAEKQEQQSRGLPERKKDGSIIVVLATDAPMHPTQLQRLARRATVGVARTGGFGSNSSGDIFIAFSTANKVPRDPPTEEGMTTWDSRLTARVEQSIEVVQDTTIDGLFQASAEVVEEAILNALCMAEDMEGPAGASVQAIDLAKVKQIVDRFEGGR